MGRVLGFLTTWASCTLITVSCWGGSPRVFSRGRGFVPGAVSAVSSVLAGAAASLLGLCRRKNTIRVESVGCNVKTWPVERQGEG